MGNVFHALNTVRATQIEQITPPASDLQVWGALVFGILIGWYVYYINRHRKTDVQLSDLVTLLGVIGGGAVLALFPPKTDLFGAYGIGLGIGFFSYFFILVVLVSLSGKFGIDFFLDGRRKKLDPDEYIPTDASGRPPMGGSGGGGTINT